LNAKLTDLYPGITYIYDPIPQGNINRPGYPLKASYITIHENGNPRGNAYNERGFTHSGGGEDTASYHFAVSYDENGPVVIQLLPLNENGWHAGDGADGTGNRHSLAIEHCQKTTDFRETMRLGALVVATLRTIPSIYPGGSAVLPNPRIVQHNYWTGKKCPQWMRERGLWDTYLAMVRDWEKKITGISVDIPPFMRNGYDMVDHKINDATWRACHRKVKALVPISGYKYASRHSVPSGYEYVQGELIEVFYVVRSEGEYWYLTRNGDRIPAVMTDRIVRVSSNVK
jgi:hypothetical protein